MNNFVVVLLYIAPPIAAATYKGLDYLGLFDYLSNRKYSLIGLKRLKSGAGYPVTFIQRDIKNDRKCFDALLILMKNNIESGLALENLRDGNVPSVITAVGQPIPIGGLPPELEQEKRCFFSNVHPIAMSFPTQNGKDNQKIILCCTIGDIERWIDKQKRCWDFWLGVVIVTLFSIVSIIIRLKGV